ncbi:class I SAM-dependent methyltransferase [Vibrio rarus]
MYTTHATEYAKVVKNNIYNAHLERPTTLSLLDIQPQQKVLDLGCGSGEHAKAIQSQGGVVTCVDLSPQMIELVNANIQPHHAYVQDLSAGLPNEEEGTYDWVIAPLVIHYIEDITALFKEIKRVLKPGGQWVFSTHHPLNDFAVSPSGNYFALEHISELWDTIGKPLPVSYYRRSLQDLFAAIHDAGFVVSQLSEGAPSPEIADRDPETYLRLTTQPSFVYMRCFLL